jgi:MFS family permease
MKLADLKNSGHWPTLLAAFLYFDFSFMLWTVLGPLGAQIGESLNLSAEQKGLMVALPILAGALLRILLGLFVDRVGAKNAGITAQLVVITGLALAWIFGLPNFEATLLMGLVLGFAGASFAVALPQAGRWYPPNMQGVVMGLAGAGNIGVVLDSLLAPRIAEAFGWKSVFGFALIPAILVLALCAGFQGGAWGGEKEKAFRLLDASQRPGCTLVLLLLHDQFRRVCWSRQFVCSLFQRRVRSRSGAWGGFRGALHLCRSVSSTGWRGDCRSHRGYSISLSILSGGGFRIDRRGADSPPGNESGAVCRGFWIAWDGQRRRFPTASSAVPQGRRYYDRLGRSRRWHRGILSR